MVVGLAAVAKAGDRRNRTIVIGGVQPRVSRITGVMGWIALTIVSPLAKNADHSVTYAILAATQRASFTGLRAASGRTIYSFLMWPFAK